MSINSIPQPAQPIAGALRVDATWYRWLRELDRLARENGTDVAAEIEAIARKLGSPDGTVDGIPPAQAQQMVGLSPITVAGQNISLQTVAAAALGELLAVQVDAFGRVTGSRPVVAGAGVTIDGTTNPDQIELRATAVAQPPIRITTDGGFRRTTQNDLRSTA